MNTRNTRFKPPKRNITWQGPPTGRSCEHRNEAIRYEAGIAHKRCLQCGLLTTSEMQKPAAIPGDQGEPEQIQARGIFPKIEHQPYAAKPHHS
jgi:hypothetical protein